MSETEKNELLVSKVSESRKQRLSTVPGLPSFVSGYSLPQTSVVGYVFAQCTLAIDVIVHLFEQARHPSKFQPVNLFFFFFENVLLGAKKSRITTTYVSFVIGVIMTYKAVSFFRVSRDGLVGPPLPHVPIAVVVSSDVVESVS